MYANEAPGLGIDIDEKLAAKFPVPDTPSFDFHWGTTRRTRRHGDPAVRRSQRRTSWPSRGSSGRHVAQIAAKLAAR